MADVFSQRFSGGDSPSAHYPPAEFVKAELKYWRDSYTNGTNDLAVNDRIFFFENVQGLILGGRILTKDVDASVTGSIGLLPDGGTADDDGILGAQAINGDKDIDIAGIAAFGGEVLVQKRSRVYMKITGAALAANNAIITLGLIIAKA